MDFCCYLRLYIRGVRNIEEAKEELLKSLNDLDFALDGLYDLSIVLSDIS
jgi:hypothetical protein